MQAAVREIEEETGWAIDPQYLVHLAFAEGDGQVGDLRGPMRDDVFVAPAPSEELSTGGLEEHELEALDRYQWWPIDDLLVTDELVFPRQLAWALAQYCAAPNWPRPVRLPW